MRSPTLPSLRAKAHNFGLKRHAPVACNDFLMPSENTIVIRDFEGKHSSETSTMTGDFLVLEKDFLMQRPRDMG